MADSPARPSLPRVILLNNEVMPYRIPLFRALHQSSKIQLRVLFSANRSWEREWELDESQLDFPHRILPGFSFRLPKARYSEKRTLFVNPTLFGELLRFRPDVVIGYEYSIPAITASLYCRLFRRPYIVWSECTMLTDSRLSRGQRWARRMILPHARAFLGTSRDACENFVRYGADREKVLEAPQVHDIQWLSSRVEAERKDSLPGLGTVLYIGSLTERKGVDLLLDAFARAAAAHPTARLRIVGNGPMRTALERKARQTGFRDRIDFIGFVEPARIPAEFAGAEMFILPSREDTFGVVVVEALACGVPVICSTFAGVSGYLRDGEDAFVVDPRDADRLAGGITRLLEEDSLRSRFADRGREIARQFDASSVAGVFLQAVQRVLPA
jgi:glycosyltransferase involved in cell wall biosynthesis